MDKFEKYKLSLNEKQKDLVVAYLEKIKKFVDKHEIETELYNDIEEMVFEKLWNETEFSDLKIIKILKEVGEPEVIFSDYVQEKTSTTKETQSELFFIKLEKMGWVRDNEGAIFLWISKTLSEKIGISILAVRIVLLILMFPLGLSIWLYILAWVLLPLKWLDYSQDSIYLFLRKQIVSAVRNWVYNLTASFLKIFPFVTKKIFELVKYVFNFVTKNIFPIFRFMFFWFIWIFLGFWIIWLLIILSFYFTNFSLENIDFLSILPIYFLYGILFSTICLSIFSIASFSFALNKKILNKYFWISWFLSFFISLFLFFSTWLDLIEKYSWRNELVQTTSINLWNSWSYVLDLDTYNNRGLDFWLWNISWIKLVNSTWSELKLEIKNTIYWNEEILDIYNNSISDVTLSNIDNLIKLSFNENKIYTKKVPFSPIKRQFTIYVPQWIKLTVRNYFFYYENAVLSKNYDKYREYLNWDCSHNEVFFSNEQDSFICTINDLDLLAWKRDYYSNYIMNNFSDLIPLKHDDNYKRKYYNDYGNYSDWFFDSIYWKDQENEKVFVDFWDKSLNINSSFYIEETGTWLIIKDFSIIDAFIDDDIFEEKYYKDLELLKKYIVE